MTNSLKRSTYLHKNEGSYDQEMSFNNHDYEKVDNLRYGTNPHQTAAFYKLKNTPSVIGDIKIVKNGKSGLSQQI